MSVCLWVCKGGLAGGDARGFQRDIPGVSGWLAAAGLSGWLACEAAQWLCKVHANWSGESEGLLHGMMLLERRHRQPEKASIR